MSNIGSLFLLLMSLTLTSACTSDDIQPPEPASQPPNILLIVVDDMGFTDIGAFGSEIRTPNLDRIAYDGVRLTNFHAAPTCATTRSMLLSGSDNHKAGMGSQYGPSAYKDFPVGRVGYERYLHPRVATLPERLNDAGYHTYMTGKWHLGIDDENKPSARGFERTFALMNGGSSHLELRGNGPKIYREDGEELSALPDNFYSTNTYTDKMIEFIAANADDDKPFFGYLALTSPHWPLQVPAEELERYAGQYDDGYDVQRARRVERALQLGVVPEVDPDLFDPQGARWDELSEDEKRYSARTMELLAAMVENMDDNVGRLVAHLKSTGQFDNTFIFFMSDNGAEADREDKNLVWARQIESSNYYDNSYDNLGKASSWAFVREGWAQASMAPYRLYKGFLTEGGTRVTSFAHHPTLASSGKIDNQYLTVMDVMPTFLSLANADFDPTSVRGRDVLPMDGKSFHTALQTSARVHGADEVIASEMQGQRSLVRGNWKIVWEQMTVSMSWQGEKPDHWRAWRLFNLADDPTEQHDLAVEEPEILAELTTLWDEWAETNGVITDVTPR
jgi:arylsulfatase